MHKLTHILPYLSLLLPLGLAIYVVLKSYQKGKPNQAFIRFGFGGTRVFFNGAFVFPMIQFCQVLDLSAKKIELRHVGDQSLVCKAGQPLDIKVSFQVSLIRTPQDLTFVAETMGVKSANCQQDLHARFAPDFSKVLESTCQTYSYSEIEASPTQFCQDVIQTLNNNLSGFQIHSCTVDYLGPAPGANDSLVPQPDRKI